MVNGAFHYLPTGAELTYFLDIKNNFGVAVFTQQEIERNFQILFAEMAGNYRRARELIRALDPTSTGKMRYFCLAYEKYKSSVKNKLEKMELLLEQEVSKPDNHQLPNNKTIIEKLSLELEMLQQEQREFQTLEEILQQQKKNLILSRPGNKDDYLNAEGPLTQLLNSKLGPKKSPLG